MSSIPSTQQLNASKDIIKIANEHIRMQLKKITKFLKNKYDIPIMTDMSDNIQLIVIPMPKSLYDNDDHCGNFEAIIRAAFNIFGLETVNVEWFRNNYYHICCYGSRYWSVNVAHHIRFWITPITGHRNITMPVRMFHHIWDIDEKEISYNEYKENALSIDEYFGGEFDIGTITVCCYINEVIRTPPPSPLFPATYNSASEPNSESDNSDSETDSANTPS
jgi:hypothetical protein